MKILDVRHRPMPISRYAPDLAMAPALDTTIVAIVTDGVFDGAPLIGLGFTSIGRFAQDGLIRERFIPRLLRANPKTLMHDDGVAIDPLKAWSVMMTAEKPGGHGERCVALGALDMAIWDIAAKARGIPLHQLFQQTFPRLNGCVRVPTYASAGYPFPDNDLVRLVDEVQRLHQLGFPALKMKIGSLSLAADCRRIEAVLSVVGEGGALAVDAMNHYAPSCALEAAKALAGYGLRWLEDPCDPLDFETHCALTALYEPPISAGEAIFSFSDARNLRRYGGLRPGHDVLTFDPAHCYGIAEFVRILDDFEADGWSRSTFFAHGGHLFSLHVAAGLGLGGCECNPTNFQPFGGFADDAQIENGTAKPPDAPGIGFERRRSLIDLFRTLL